MSELVSRWCGVHGLVRVPIYTDRCLNCGNPLIAVDVPPPGSSHAAIEGYAEVYRVGWADNESLRRELMQAYGFQIAVMATLAVATAIIMFTASGYFFAAGAVVIGALCWGILDSWRRRRVHKDALP